MPPKGVTGDPMGTPNVADTPRKGFDYDNFLILNYSCSTQASVFKLLG